MHMPTSHIASVSHISMEGSEALKLDGKSRTNAERFGEVKEKAEDIIEDIFDGFSPGDPRADVPFEPLRKGRLEVITEQITVLLKSVADLLQAIADLLKGGAALAIALLPWRRRKKKVEAAKTP